MPDYCMCNGVGCDRREQCFRYRAIPCPYRQSYFTESPICDGDCQHFMPVEGWPEKMLRPEGAGPLFLNAPIQDNQSKFDNAVWLGVLRTIAFGCRCVSGFLGTIWWLIEVTLLWPFALIGWKEHAGEFPWWLYSGDDSRKPED